MSHDVCGARLNFYPFVFMDKYSSDPERRLPTSILTAEKRGVKV